jgi:hypothetical protein
MAQRSQSIDEVILSAEGHRAREGLIQSTPNIEWIGSEDHYDQQSNELSLTRDYYSEGNTIPRTIVGDDETYEDYEIPLPTGMSTVSSKLHRKRSGGSSMSFDRDVCRAASIAEEGDRERDDEDDEESIGFVSKTLMAGVGGRGEKGGTMTAITSEFEEDSFGIRQNHTNHPSDYDSDYGNNTQISSSTQLQQQQQQQHERFESRVRVRNKPEDRDDEHGNSRNKSQTLIGGKNQDYLALARLYRIQRPYSDPNYQALCLLCQREYCEDVFFPCEHHCVCRKCMKKEKICEESYFRHHPEQGGCCNCSLCASIIKKIFPLENGKEVGKYWDWVYEEKIDLPIGFMRNWRHSAAVIQKIYIDEKYQNYGTEGVSSFCAIS